MCFFDEEAGRGHSAEILGGFKGDGYLDVGIDGMIRFLDEVEITLMLYG